MILVTVIGVAYVMLLSLPVTTVHWYVTKNSNDITMTSSF